MTTRSIHTLSATLQTVWTAAYQASLQGQYTWQANPLFASMAPTEATAKEAEEHAWEAVRRANGGTDPDVPAPPVPATDVTKLLADVGGIQAIADRLDRLSDALQRPTCSDGSTAAEFKAEIASIRDAACRSWLDLADLLSIVRGPAFVALSTDEDVIDALMPVVVETMWGGADASIYDPGAATQEMAHARAALRNPDDPGLTDTDALIARVALAAAKALNRRSAPTAAPTPAPQPDEVTMLRALAPILAQARFADMWTTLAPHEQTTEFAAATRALESPGGPRVDALLGTYATIARAAWSAALAVRST